MPTSGRALQRNQTVLLCSEVDVYTSVLKHFTSCGTTDDEADTVYADGKRAVLREMFHLHKELNAPSSPFRRYYAQEKLMRLSKLLRWDFGM